MTEKTTKVETTLIDITQDAAAAAGIEGSVRLTDVEVDDEALANVTLHLKEVTQNEK
jgi:hypothetical protein